MKVHRFSPETGTYHFTVQGLATGEHFHPMTEVLTAETGSFTVELAGEKHEHQSFFVVPAGEKHRVIAEGSVQLVLLEHRRDFVEQYVREATRPLVLPERDYLSTYEPRVATAMQLMQASELGYGDFQRAVTDRVHLSKSRIAHLFRAETGVSLRRYFVWSRLRLLMTAFLAGEGNFYELSLRYGFHDQAHFSRAFKDAFGVPPSEPYNSSFLQE